jgi:hypothetical protein
VRAAAICVAVGLLAGGCGSASSPIKSDPRPGSLGAADNRQVGRSISDMDGNCWFQHHAYEFSDEFSDDREVMQEVVSYAKEEIERDKARLDRIARERPNATYSGRSRRYRGRKMVQVIAIVSETHADCPQAKELGKTASELRAGLRR